MKIEDFADLPKIDERDRSERLKIHERVRAELPLARGGYRYFIEDIKSIGFIFN